MRMHHRSLRGFTLVEIMLAVAISAVVVGLATTFFISSLKSLTYTTNQICLNRDVRYLTQRLMKQGRQAGQFILYQSFTTRTACASGESGDYLVLMTMDDDGLYVTKSIGFYRDSNNAVRRYEQTEPGTSTSPTLPDTSTISSNPIVVEFAKDVVETGGYLFYNLSGSGIVVYGQIKDNGKQLIKSTDVTTSGTAVSTYNFTITPRG